MNITEAEVIDPRIAGQFQDPDLIVKVDEEVYEQAKPVFDYKKLLQYRVIPCGPFFAVEYRPDNGVTYDNWVNVSVRGQASLGEFNKAGIIKDQLCPVVVIDKAGEQLDLAMPVQRARRLLRKYALSRWTIEVDREAALLGYLKWGLESTENVCYGGAVPFADRCMHKPIQTLVYKDTHLPLCSGHVTQHQSRFRLARVSN